MGIQGWLLYVVSDRFFRIPFELGRVFGFLILCISCYLLFSHIPIAERWVDFSVRVLSLAAFPFLMILFRVVSPEEVRGLRRLVRDRIKKRVPRRERIEIAEV